MDINRIYIFDTMEIATAFRMTAYYLGFEVTQTGSTVIAPKEVYQSVIDKTYAIPAAIVAVEVED